MVVVRTLAARGVARRQGIPAGHPGALSWELVSWLDDDAAWYVTEAHPGGLTQEQVATLMGISPVRVSQLELEALEKLRVGFEAILAAFAPSQLEQELGEALEPEDLLLGMFVLFDRHRRAEARALTEPDHAAASAL
jgi:ParB-like chromosome segregation protein Spo0J